MCVSHVRRMAREKAAGLSSMRALSRGCSARDALDAEITSGKTDRKQESQQQLEQSLPMPPTNGYRQDRDKDKILSYRILSYRYRLSFLSVNGLPLPTVCSRIDVL